MQYSYVGGVFFFVVWAGWISGDATGRFRVGPVCFASPKSLSCTNIIMHLCFVGTLGFCSTKIWGIPQLWREPLGWVGRWQFDEHNTFRLHIHDSFFCCAYIQLLQLLYHHLPVPLFYESEFVASSPCALFLVSNFGLMSGIGLLKFSPEPQSKLKPLELDSTFRFSSQSGQDWYGLVIGSGKGPCSWRVLNLSKQGQTTNIMGKKKWMSVGGLKSKIDDHQYHHIKWYCAAAVILLLDHLYSESPIWMPVVLFIMQKKRWNFWENWISCTCKHHLALYNHHIKIFHCLTQDDSYWELCYQYGASGKLMEVSKIVWYNDDDDTQPMSLTIPLSDLSAPLNTPQVVTSKGSGLKERNQPLLLLEHIPSGKCPRLKKPWQVFSHGLLLVCWGSHLIFWLDLIDPSGYSQ